MTDEEFARLIADDPAFSPRPPKHVPSTFAQKSGKVGRNDPCPCNSGRKYKKCCIGRPVR